MGFQGAKLIQSWNQDLALKKSNYPNGMCILFAFHFGARRMIHMNDNLAMQDTMELSTVEGSLILDKFNDIYSMYRKGYGNFKDEVVNIATLYEPYYIADSLHFQVTDYFHYDKASINGTKDLHLVAAEAILYDYWDQFHSNGFLMIGIKTRDGYSHALSLLMTPDEKYILFDPNYGWYSIDYMPDFISDYGKETHVIEWDLAFVKQE